MNIPSFFLSQSRLASDVIKLVDTLPNDMDLGKAIRKRVNEYKKPISNSDLEFATDNKTKN